MKFLVVFATVLVAAYAVDYEQLFAEEWNLFKAEHQKTYAPLEDLQRRRIFMENKLEVAEHNLRYRNGEETYEMELNEFSDWLPEEIYNRNGLNKDLRDRLNAGEDVEFPEMECEEFCEVSPNATAPAYINWADKGAVATVKNQGSCGSCYAFSALGALETQVYLRSKKLVKLSEQNIVDCSGKFGNLGCNGGSADRTYNYIKDNRGVNTEAAYPYEGKQGKCRFKKDNVGATCTGYTKVGATEEALKQAVATAGSISVGINTLPSLSKYKGGIYSDPKCKNDLRSLDHAVLLVGYGTDSATKQDYWIVRNSWGTGWGEKGYVRIARNKGNMCGIATYAMYPRI